MLSQNIYFISPSALRRGLFFLPSGRLVRRLFSFHFPVAGWLREFNKNPKRSQTWPTEIRIPASAKTPIRELCTTPSPRARTRTRGMSYGDINNIQFSHIIEALAKHRAWEGQRPRCPRFAAVWATRTLPLSGFAGVSIVHES